MRYNILIPLAIFGGIFGLYVGALLFFKVYYKEVEYYDMGSKKKRTVVNDTAVIWTVVIVILLLGFIAF